MPFARVRPGRAADAWLISPGVAQLVGCLLWEQEAASSSLATRTSVVADCVSFATTFLFKRLSHSLRRSSFPNQTRFAGLRFGALAVRHSADCLLSSVGRGCACGLLQSRRSLIWEQRLCAAGGRRSKDAVAAAVEKCERHPLADAFFVYPKEARSEEAASSSLARGADPSHLLYIVINEIPPISGRSEVSHFAINVQKRVILRLRCAPTPHGSRRCSPAPRTRTGRNPVRPGCSRRQSRAPRRHVGHCRG